MSKVFQKLLLLLVFCFGGLFLYAQDKLPIGSLEVSARVKIEGKTEKLSRKRFYIFRGGLEENKPLIEKLKSADIISRDCYYSQKQASPQFICWLKEENCESPYCRTISQNDVDQVPEFQSAYQKGLKQFGKAQTEIARNWLTTNLMPDFRDGFYQRQQSLIKSLLGNLKPLRSSMTDSVSVKAIFIDIPLILTNSEGKIIKEETFLVSNLLPMEVGNKSYVWACEVEIGKTKLEKLNLKVPDDNKPIRGCEVIVKDLPVCKTEGCKK